MNAAAVVEQAKAQLPWLSTEGRVLLAIGLLLVALLCVVAYLWWRRRKARAAATDAAPPRAAAAPDPAALGRAIGRGWRRFTVGLARVAQRSLDDFHPVILLGTESAGKAELIERFGGVVQRRVELGEGAACVDGPLRCSLGIDAVYLDLAEEAVRAPRQRVEAGLRRALAPALRRRAPVIVVCLSPETLERQTVQQLAELGGALRSKLDVIAELRDEAPAVRIAVHGGAGGAARLAALFPLLRLPGVPSVLDVSAPGEEALRSALLGYADHLFAAAAQLPPAELLELVSVLEAVPQLAGALSIVLGALFAAGGERTPRPDGLYLVPPDGGSDPLAVPQALRLPGPSPLLQHRLVAVTAALVVVALLAATYLREQESWARAAQAAWTYEPTQDHELDLRLAIRTYVDGADRTPPRLGLFGGGPRTVACTFVETVRQDYLVRELRAALTSPAARREPERLLYLEALLYATRDDPLGNLVADRAEDWATAVRLPSSLVADYLHLATAPYRDLQWIDRLERAQHAAPAGGVEERLHRFLILLSRDHVLSPGELDEAARLALELRGAAVFGAARRVLQIPPLKRLETAFKVDAARLDLLAELGHNRVAVDTSIEAVLAAVPSNARTPESFAELVATVTPLLTPADGAGATTTFVVKGTEYVLDPGPYVRARRGADAARLLTGFLDTLPSDLTLLFFPGPPSGHPLPLALAWPAGVTGGRALDRDLSRESFETKVRPVATGVQAIVARLDGRPELQDQLARVLADALEQYAGRYAEQLDGLIGSVRVEARTEAGAERILRVLAGNRSPVRELLRVAAHDADLGLPGDPATPLRALLDVQDRFRPLGAVFQAGKGGDALTAYQDVLRGVADALAEPPLAARGGKAAPAEDAGFAATLSPAGRIAHAALTGAPDGADVALQAWIGAVALPEDLAHPFREPLRAVYALGARNVQRELERWDRDLERELELELFGRFPFDRGADVDVDPDALAAWLHPRRGRLATKVLPALEGLVARRSDGSWRPVAARACSAGAAPPCVDVPARLLASLDRLSAAATLLWDDAGKPRPIQVAMTPRPFAVSVPSGPSPELVRLTAGDASIVYFNQRPKRTILSLDWTRDHSASLAVEGTDRDGVSLAPPAMADQGSPWSLLRLLERAERRGPTRTFRLQLAPGQTLTVRYDVNDPTLETLRAPASAARGAAP